MKKLLLAVVCCLIFTIASLPACVSVGGYVSSTGGVPSWMTPPVVGDWPVFLDYNQGTPENPYWQEEIQGTVSNTTTGFYLFVLPQQGQYAPYGQYRVRLPNMDGTFLEHDIVNRKQMFKFTYDNSGCTDYTDINQVLDFLNY